MFFTIKAKPVYEDIFMERLRQDGQWGGSAHDDKHTNEDWAVYLRKQVFLYGVDRNPVVQRERLVKIAALAVAAIESLDRCTNTSEPNAELIRKTI